MRDKTSPEHVLVPLDSLDSVVLLTMGVGIVRDEAEKNGNCWDYSLPLGCVTCTKDVLTTHVVEGYGGLCAGCAPAEPRAQPLPWAGPFSVLHRRGFELPER